MKKRSQGYNPKRRILPLDQSEEQQRENWASSAQYGGNPEHKKYPGDYDLTPPSNPRPGKTLCDGKRAILKAEAVSLLKSGLRCGMVSQRMLNDWPQNVWAVTGDDSQEVFEAQLENQEQGVYHGYPMPEDDAFRQIVINEWEKRAK